MSPSFPATPFDGGVLVFHLRTPKTQVTRAKRLCSRPRTPSKIGRWEKSDAMLRLGSTPLSRLWSSNGVHLSSAAAKRPVWRTDWVDWRRLAPTSSSSPPLPPISSTTSSLSHRARWNGSMSAG
jgi:hypothetical protein